MGIKSPRSSFFLLSSPGTGMDEVLFKNTSEAAMLTATVGIPLYC